MEPATHTLRWSTNALMPASRFAAWRDVVNATHLSWDIRSRRDAGYDADIAQSLLGSARIVECQCDPCGGSRSRSEIASTATAYFGVLHLLSGRERITQGGREAWLSAGDIVVWDSTRAIDFEIGDRLHKVTFLFPQTMLGSNALQYENTVARVLPAKRGSTALLASHLTALAAHCGDISAKSVVSVLEATLDLISNAVQLVEDAELGSRYVQSLIARIQAYVLEHLADSELCPDQIAHVHGISRRQLHRVFQHTEMTIDKWIWTERLKRCRHDLVARNTPISAVAFRWGFRDPSHFSRAFRAKYGVTPNAWRQAHSAKATR